MPAERDDADLVATDKELAALIVGWVLAADVEDEGPNMISNDITVLRAKLAELGLEIVRTG
jgi:hypothetical protein